MQNLSGKQKRYLRARANQMSPIFSVGKNGLSKVWLGEVSEAMKKRELVKVNIQQASPIGKDELADFIEQHSDITVVQKIGRTLVLYLPSDDPDYQEYSVTINHLG